MEQRPIARVEVGVTSVADARVAEAAGASFVLVHAGATEGGTTPSAGTIAGVRGAVGIDVGVLVRPRGGDFLYDADELSAMRRDVFVARDAGADYVALGVLDPSGAVAEAAVKELVEAARPLPVTFHRAFDMVRDPATALDVLAGLGVARILTSGQSPTVLDGLERITELVRRAAGRLRVVPAGHVERSTVRLVVERTGAGEVHVAPTEVVASTMEHRNLRCHLGVRRDDTAEYERVRLDPRLLGGMMEQLGVSGG